jgi:hypothetical protein
VYACGRASPASGGPRGDEPCVPAGCCFTQSCCIRNQWTNPANAYIAASPFARTRLSVPKRRAYGSLVPSKTVALDLPDRANDGHVAPTKLCVANRRCPGRYPVCGNRWGLPGVEVKHGKELPNRDERNGWVGPNP